MGSFLENIYDDSPIFFQNIMTTVKGYRNYRVRYGKTYWEYRKFYKKFDEMSLPEKLDYQEKELIQFVKYAYENSPFYHKLYAGIDINGFKETADLKKLPLVDKEMLRSNIDSVFTIKPREGVENNTGGTTGKSLTVLSTVEDVMKRMAMLDNFKHRVGFENLKMRRATFNGKHIVPPKQKKKIFWRYNRACKQMIFSSFHITEKNIKYYVEELNRFKPQALDGFFTSMCDIANYIERHQIPLSFTPVAIFPTSETLTEEGRALLERVFKSKVYNQYASSEGAPFVTECPKQVLHMELASGVFEYLEEDSNEILVTSFTTHGTPLIRYRIGDSMEFTRGDADVLCGCGIQAPIVQNIQGRALDYLYTLDGAKINAGNVANLFKHIPNALIRAQMQQKSMNTITALLEVDPKTYKPEYDEIFREEFEHIFAGTNLIIRHVEEIQREKSGKFRLVKNEVEF